MLSAAHGKIISLGLVCCALAACSSNPFGPPDVPSDPIPPARPSPFAGSGSGGDASPWAAAPIDTANTAPLSSH